MKRESCKLLEETQADSQDSAMGRRVLRQDTEDTKDRDQSIDDVTKTGSIHKPNTF